MGTRCQIKAKTEDEDCNKIYIYKHWDGYPSNVMPILEPLVADFFIKRGPDMPYLLCQIVRAFAVRDHETGRVESFTGWGLDTCKHGDISYLYEIDESGQIFINGKVHTYGSAYEE